MYIEPNSTIRVYNHIPLDNTYENTIYFTDATAQRNYFATGIKYTFQEQTYQRVANSRGKIKVEKVADSLYDCNYMAFQNTNYGSKWFYAFITSVEYINNTTSEITFEIDVMQTYLFDVELLACFVEREHSATDIAGDNIVEENVKIGEYEVSNYQRSGHFNNWGVMVQSPYNFGGENVTFADTTNRFGDVPSGLNLVLLCRALYYYNQGQSSEILNPYQWLYLMIENFNNKGVTDSIVSMFMFPTDFVSYKYPPYNTDSNDRFNLSGSYNMLQFTRTKPSSNGSYVPKNKKLLTYPYCYLGMSNGTNQDGKYRYEWWRNGAPKFEIIPDAITGSFLCQPLGYNNGDSTGTQQTNSWNFAMTLSDLPQIPYKTDTFKIWFAQNKVKFTTSNVLATGMGIAGATAASLLTGGVGAVAGAGIMSSLTGAGLKLANSVGGYQDMMAKPDFVRGTAGSTIPLNTHQLDFITYDAHLQPEYARIIDDYFTMYGYATKRIKVPNRNVRPHWTYTKTIGCNVIGSCPADDTKKICEIYDKGITFWRHANEVGNYTLNNAV